MNTYGFRTALMVSIVLTFAACVPGRQTGTDATKAAIKTPRVVTVAYVEGSASVDGVAAEAGMALGAAFVVTTGPASRCDIVFDGGNVLSVSQNSLASIDLGKVAVGVRLDKGGLTSVLRKLAKLSGNDSFSVETSNAIAGVRGTSFCVWADESSTYVCACNGAVRTIDAKGGNERSLESAHHVARIYSRQGEKIDVAEAGMLHHSDASVESAASRIGYAIDWSVIDRRDAP